MTAYSIRNGDELYDDNGRFAGVRLPNGETQFIPFYVIGANGVDLSPGMAVDARMFGAAANGEAADNDAIERMASVLGYVRFGHGSHLLTTITIDVPVFFDTGASITAETGQTVTITNRVESGRQWIFKGDGTYVLGNDANSGEDSRQIHVSWFGAFPGLDADDTRVDQAPFIAKAFSALGNSRESVVDFDIGSYQIFTQMSVPRACWVRGQGSRRTVFKMCADGFDTFKTIGEAARFTGIQFENLTTEFLTRTSSMISLETANCELDDVFTGRALQAIKVTGSGCKLANLGMFYDEYAGAGSCLVAVRASNVSIDTIQAVMSTSYGPDFLVHVGADIGGAASAISNVSIKNVNSTCPAGAVLLDANAINISRVDIDDIRYNTSTGSAPANIVKLLTTGTSINIEDVSIDGLMVGSHATNALRIEQNSTGTTQDVSIDNTVVTGATGSGFEFVRTAGTLKDVVIGANVDVSERTTPYSYSGTVSGFRISPTALPNVQPGLAYDFTIADDSVASIALNRSVFTGFLMVSAGSTNYGIYVARAASTPAITSVSASANMATATTLLEGTTGTDAKFTVGVTDGVLYFENRLGSSQRVTVALLTGVA